MSFEALRSVRSHSFAVDLPAERAFTLFTPEGERAWAEGWNPRYLHPADGRTEAGMAFTTGHGQDETIWTMTRHDVAACIVEYVRTTPGNRTAVVLVQCAALGPGRTRVTVVYALTGLSEAGNAYIREMDEARYRAFIDGWGEAIAKAIRPIS
jgi:hypothetical protein